MRPTLVLLLLPFALAACSSAPPPTRVVVTPPTPAPPPPPQVSFQASSPTQGAMVAQCQGLFAQALAGQPVSYSEPSISVVGDLTTIQLAAMTAANQAGPPLQYTCSFNGAALATAGRS